MLSFDDGAAGRIADRSQSVLVIDGYPEFNLMNKSNGLSEKTMLLFISNVMYLALPLQTWQIVFTVIIIGLLSEIVRKGIDMLKIFMKSSVYNTSVYFKHAYEDKWITDPVAKEMIKDIDKSEVLDSGVIDSPVLGKIPPVQLSGGVKTLILIKNEPEKVFNASNCGDNCAHWLLKLAKDKDITVNMYHIMDFGNEPFEIEILNNHMVVHDMDELVLTAGQYV